MIDWLSIRIPYAGPPFGHEIYKRDLKSGEAVKIANRSAVVRNSAFGGFSVHVIGGEMSLSGNPVKMMTGQNVVGTEQINELAVWFFEMALIATELPDCKVARRALAHGDVEVTRVDVNKHFRVGSTGDVRQWLRAVAGSTTVTHRGRGMYDDGMASVLFGVRRKAGKLVGSTYASFKFYCKWSELKKNPPKIPQLEFDKLLGMVEGEVRAEALYRRRELLEMGLNRLSEWDHESPSKLFEKWIAKMEMPNAYRETDVSNIPTAFRSSAQLWLSGVDVREMVSRPTFYRHRKGLLEFGIDLIAEPPKGKRTVIPVIQVIEARPVDETLREQYFWSLVERRAA